MRGRTVALLAITALALISLGIGAMNRGRDDAAATGDGRAVLAGDAVVQLEIRNGSGVSGLAADLSLLLGRAGATAVLLANAPHEGFDRSLLVNRRLDDETAADLAARLGGVPVVLEFDPAAGADAVLVLGADHARVSAALAAAAEAP